MSETYQKTTGDRVASWVMGIFLVGVVGLTLSLILTGMHATRGSQRHEGTHRIRNLGLAYMNHAAQTVELTRDVTAGDGTPLHSWQTLLLTSIDQMALARHIDLTKPWNDNVNRAAMQTKLTALVQPESSETLQAGTDFGLTHYSANAHVLGNEQLQSLEELGAGASQTVLIGEINDAFPPWGQPGNVRDPARGLNVTGGFGHERREGVLFVFCDGRAEMVGRNVDRVVLEQMAGNWMPTDR